MIKEMGFRIVAIILIVATSAVVFWVQHLCERLGLFKAWDLSSDIFFVCVWLSIESVSREFQRELGK